MHNIEKRFGVKIKNIFLIRFLISKILIWQIIIITFLVQLMGFSLMDNLPKDIYLTKLILPFAFYFLYDVFIFSIILFLIFIIHQIIVIFIPLLMSFLIILNPLIFNYKYFNNYEGKVEYELLKNQTILTAKIFLGKNFNNFIKKNYEYSFLNKEYLGFNISWNNGIQHYWDLYERAFYFGDIFFEDFKKEF
ncbi:hypothetical protein [Spiroplasma taiwanense]|uniref:Transmembrane protein n=1 Tax=Spiroplasma taiwanense CT-1 TaxID=1276220 RepID=S5LYQ5_9MOLU|nr:hypothetical protein [Spiroplasma taiwanense]AGR40802.1 hypothetical protein STAIW_v1c01160 [Spiroplasma taiwanense CT-1]